MNDAEDHQTRTAQTEPWWIVVAQITDEEYASATVDAPTEDDADAEGQRVIAGNEGTDEFDVRRVRGPFPRSPGEANFEVRPQRCHGCGLQLWCGNHAPTPNHTWFERSSSEDDRICWRCIQCGTKTVTGP